MLNQVSLLAANFHWSEDHILNLSSRLRLAYCGRVTDMIERAKRPRR
jgi:hypothetical protein